MPTPQSTGAGPATESYLAQHTSSTEGEKPLMTHNPTTGPELATLGNNCLTLAVTTSSLALLLRSVPEFYQTPVSQAWTGGGGSVEPESWAFSLKQNKWNPTANKQNSAPLKRKLCVLSTLIMAE